MGSKTNWGIAVAGVTLSLASVLIVAMTVAGSAWPFLAVLGLIAFFGLLSL